MNTYQVIYWPPVAPGATTTPSPVSSSYQAAEVLINDHTLMLLDDSHSPVLIVPMTLDPVVVKLMG